MQLIAASSRVLVSSCHNCTLYLGTTSPPMLIGDCRFLRLAPFNAHYERQMAHVRAVGLRLDLPNRWDAPLVLAGKERKNSSSGSSNPDSPNPGGSGKGAASMCSLLPPEDFLPFVVPFQGGSGVLAGGSAPAHSTAWRHLAPAIARTSAAAAASGSTQVAAGGALYLFPLPTEYERVLLRKLSMTGELRHRFRQVGLSKEKERELNDTIQSHFKEWLSSSNMLRQIYDLSNLEKDEVNISMSGGLTPPPKERTTLHLA
ncbi:hypothetical protein DUNSADRAFT_8836 [Dunaliella salina]|uniref:C-CAP/cofactor C-like domain-containing protein n=1 Tax=Dunaliella salina TaxID=3046 RepID=A0ABQ7GIP3_DUNSA|nr:hypothetical protein DUNSADRAFT_8836 [Dunaliella salina]|eukprot:KAF5834480.1 hypothetical protein DUNSADRAFT_8836 [Dunaliella salina]